MFTRNQCDFVFGSSDFQRLCFIELQALRHQFELQALRLQFVKEIENVKALIVKVAGQAVIQLSKRALYRRLDETGRPMPQHQC